MTHTFTPPTASEGIEAFLEQHKADIAPKGRAYIRECAAKMIQFCALPEDRAKHVPPEQHYRSRDSRMFTPPCSRLDHQGIVMLDRSHILIQSTLFHSAT